ncbi:MAG: virulence factor TspB C-terminal domain-related protein, partial [FCB group bacterium]|nr:virulence factor TspB C-terminal domain-related protein [FCB group bacterium]
YTAPPPLQPAVTTPILCPDKYRSNPTLGLCSSGESPGTPPTLEGPGGQPTSGTGSCPLGYVQQPDGRCTSTTPTTTCPQGYFLNNGQCVSNGSYDPTTGTPSGSNGTGTGTCGGPGQPPCKIDLGGPGDIEGPQLFELPEFEFDLSTLQPIDLGAPAAQCPPDVELPRGIVWSWATTCSFAEWMRPIFLGMAWLFAGFIVLSGIPRD